MLHLSKVNAGTFRQLSGTIWSFINRFTRFALIVLYNMYNKILETRYIYKRSLATIPCYATTHGSLRSHTSENRTQGKWSSGKARGPRKRVATTRK